MSEARLYSYSEFKKTPKPNDQIYNVFESSNAEIRASLSRLQEYWQDHLNKSRIAIQAAAGKAGTSKAIIYGAGNCIDIPLTDLVDKFDHLTVVDIESRGVTGAIERLPGSLQAKVDLHIEDLTGVAAEVTDTFSLLLSRSKDPASFAEKVLESLPGIHPKAPDFGSQYDFVCSNLVGSQLPSLLGVSFAVLGNGRYPSAKLTEDSIVMEALKINRPDLTNALVHVLQRDHMGLLLDSARQPGGVVYFADTFDVAYLRRDLVTKQPYFIDENGGPVSSPNKIPILSFDLATIREVKTRTQIGDVQEWSWYRQPPIGTSTGRAFGIKSLTLLLK